MCATLYQNEASAGSFDNAASPQPNPHIEIDKFCKAKVRCIIFFLVPYFKMRAPRKRDDKPNKIPENAYKFMFSPLTEKNISILLGIFFKLQ